MSSILPADFTGCSAWFDRLLASWRQMCPLETLHPDLITKHDGLSIHRATIDAGRKEDFYFVFYIPFFFFYSLIWFWWIERTGKASLPDRWAVGGGRALQLEMGCHDASGHTWMISIAAHLPLDVLPVFSFFFFSFLPNFMSMNAHFINGQQFSYFLPVVSFVFFFAAPAVVVLFDFSSPIQQARFDFLSHSPIQPPI